MDSKDSITNSYTWTPLGRNKLPLETESPAFQVQCADHPVRKWQIKLEHDKLNDCWSLLIISLNQGVLHAKFDLEQWNEKKTKKVGPLLRHTY